MKRELIKLLIISVLIAVLFVRCDDNNPSYEQKVIENVELLNVLKSKGVLTFEGNLLVMDDKVKELKELDLSGTKISDFSGLDIFPNLESLILKNNNYGISFDFSKLPATVKRVNLQDNDIYDYLGLIEVNFETAEMKVLRTFEEINLPATARYNMEALPFYSKESATTKLTMQNKETKAVEAYTTLREVPDELIRAFLKNSFSSIMTEDGKIDISKKLSTEQESIPFIVDMTFYNEPVSGPVDITVAESIEGVEYIINNPFYKGTQLNILTKEDQEFNLNYLKPRKNLEFIWIERINTPIVDWSNAEHLRFVIIYQNKSIKTLDYSNSKYFMQREGGLDQSDGIVDTFRLYDCPELTTIKLPDVEPTLIHSFYLCKLPKLNELDIKNITGFTQVLLADLPMIKELSFEAVTHTANIFTGEVDKEGDGVIISITKDIIDTKGVKEFIIRFGKANKIYPSEYSSIETEFYGYGQPYMGKAYDYTFLYSNETSTLKVSESKKAGRFSLNPREMSKRHAIRKK